MPPLEPLRPQDTLPNYATAIQDRHLIRVEPLTPVIYTFTSWAQGSDSMLLMPPREENQQPLYRIAVQLDLNPFLPVSYITRVFRCGVLEDGELVGEFGLTWSGMPSWLQIGDTTSRRISSVLTHGMPKCFNWNVKNDFHWDCRSILDDGSPMCICYAHLPSSLYRVEPVQVAIFVPPPPDALPPLPEATLTIFPLGHRLMDEILVSLLVVMRMLNR